MENFKMDPWGKSYPGFHITFGSAEQLGAFVTTLKQYNPESSLCAAYDLCANMPENQIQSSLHVQQGDPDDFFAVEYDIFAEKAEENVFHIVVTRTWSPLCLVIDLSGTIKGDYHFFGSFTTNDYYPAKLGEILEKVARDYPQQNFAGVIYSDDGDHFSDTAEFSYADNALNIRYTDDSGEWASRPVSICL